MLVGKKQRFRMFLVNITDPENLDDVQLCKDDTAAYNDLLANPLCRLVEDKREVQRKTYELDKGEGNSVKIHREYLFRSVKWEEESL